MEQLKQAQAWLASIHPGVPGLTVTALILVTVYGTRRFAPSLWAWLDARLLPTGKPVSNVLLGLPSVAAGALVGAYMSGGDFDAAWQGALCGALAPVAHHLLKALPGPYNGAAELIKAAKDGDQ